MRKRFTTKYSFSISVYTKQ